MSFPNAFSNIRDGFWWPLSLLDVMRQYFPLLYTHILNDTASSVTPSLFHLMWYQKCSKLSEPSDVNGTPLASFLSLQALPGPPVAPMHERCRFAEICLSCLQNFPRTLRSSYTIKEDPKIVSFCFTKIIYWKANMHISATTYRLLQCLGYTLTLSCAT